MTDFPRLIEFAFPLKQASLDSVHEKNVRHGHISTLHIWPARRPLAACRAALIATLLPDPSAEPKSEGMSEAEWQKEIQRRRQELCEKIGGKVVKRIERKKMPGGQVVEREKEETEGGILHWGRETENADTLEWFRQEIRKAYGGRAPKVLDPFAGGGAIPLEAMRLGCEATAIDINPVAWFILKCTLEYPQKLAGKTLPLPEFILENEEFMNAFYKAHPHLVGRTKRTKKQEQEFAQDLFLKDKPDSGRIPKADLAWHVRAWGQWVLERARRELARFYPVYADFEPLEVTGRDACSRKQPMRLVPLKEDGTPDIDALNSQFSKQYLADKRNPRWIAKPTVAYLWARTVTCKNCRATIPLLKTRWLCKKDRKRVLLTMQVAQASVPVPDADAPAGTPEPTTPQERFSQYRRNLPHWRLEGATYFVTWRLHKNQRALQPDERDAVLSALRHFDGQRYDLHAWVVMDDHVHVIVKPHPGCELSQLTHSWKSFTANQLQRSFRRQGAVWQDESWDRIIRDEDEFWEKVEYLLNNPKKHWPEIQDYRWVGWRHSDESTGTEAGATNIASVAKSVEQASVPVPQVIFGIETNVPVKGGNAAQRREHDKRLGAGTMSRAGSKCPCCGVIMTMEDIRLEGRAGRLGAMATAVIVDGLHGQEYRLPTEHERRCAAEAANEIERIFGEIPFGLPTEPIASAEALGMRVPLYGFDRWDKLFTPRQLAALGTFCRLTRSARDVLRDLGYPTDWCEAIGAGLAIGMDRLVDKQSVLCRWDNTRTNHQGTFTRFALPMMWDYCEGNPLSSTTGNYGSCIEWVAECFEHSMTAGSQSPPPRALAQSATLVSGGPYDAIVTDPPYYDAIGYSVLMDFFYVWLRRTLYGLSPEIDAVFRQPLAPKWDAEKNDGELVDDASRFGGDAQKSQQAYEEGMFRAFRACHEALRPEGRLVIVFANKQPEAWETLVSALIRAGFVVDGSWPIQTEMGNRTRALTGAALASSVWLVCKRRVDATSRRVHSSGEDAAATSQSGEDAAATSQSGGTPLLHARPGWDSKVLEEMRANITARLRDFWDAGIRGPDFVWAATGPALEAYSKHPVVKKADDPGQVLTVSEFLSHVRRMVVDFVVGRVLQGERGTGVSAGQQPGTEAWSTDRLDELTAYYLLHRHDFGLEEAPVGACILYATACGLSDQGLVGDWDLLVKSGSDVSSLDENAESDEPEEDSGEDAAATDSGSRVKLKAWNQRRGRSMGYEAPGGRPVPLIDRIHRLMHLWKGGDVHKVDEYLDEHGLRRHELFRRVLQSLIELSKPGSEERSLLESLSNHIGAKGATRKEPQASFAFDHEE